MTMATPVVFPTDGSGPLSAAPALRRRQLHVFARRFINPWVMRLGIPGARWSPIGLVIHVGRRSKRTLATPLAVHRRGTHFWIPLTYGPGARWCQNVLAAGSCRLRLHASEIVLSEPSLATRDDLPRSLRLFYRVVGIRDFLSLQLVRIRPDPPPRSR